MERETRETTLLSSLLAALPNDHRRTLKRIIDGEASGWLTVLPLASESFIFRRRNSGIRWHCDITTHQFLFQQSVMGVATVSRFSMHWTAKKGGLVKKGHNDVRDNDVRLAEEAWGGVTVEPVLVPEDDRTGHTAFQADWCVRGMWEGSRVAFFDCRIIDADAPSYLSSNLSC